MFRVAPIFLLSGIAGTLARYFVHQSTHHNTPQHHILTIATTAASWFHTVYRCLRQGRYLATLVCC